MGNGQTSVAAADRKTVVVVGLGPAGVGFLRGLIKAKATGAFNIVIVEPRDSYHHAIGALRSLVEPALAGRVIMPYAELISHVGPTARVVAGKATDITESKVVVALNAGGSEELAFDYLVIGVGSTIPFPGQWSGASGEAARALYASAQTTVAAAKSIVIVGGGAVGIELAGELATGYKGAQAKTITIVNSGATLLAHERLKPETLAAVETKLKAVGVQIINGQRATVTSDSKSEGGFDTAATVTLANGNTLQADVVFYCTGARTNSGCIKGALASKLDNNRLKVALTLQVEGFPNIFAGGDICNTPEGKLAYLAGVHGDLIAQNLVALLKGKALKEHKPSPPVIFLPIGKGDGVGQLPNGMIVGKRMVPMVKGKDLFIGATRKNLFLPA